MFQHNKSHYIMYFNFYVMDYHISEMFHMFYNTGAKIELCLKPCMLPVISPCKAGFTHGNIFYIFFSSGVDPKEKKKSIQKEKTYTFVFVHPTHILRHQKLHA